MPFNDFFIDLVGVSAGCPVLYILCTLYMIRIVMYNVYNI